MANIGNLSFGIGGDDKELRKILDDRKKDAIELQKLLSSFNLGNKKPNTQLTETVRNQEKLNRLEQSNLRLQETRDRVAANSLISQQRVNQAAQRTNAIQLQNLRLDNDRIASEQRVRTEAERTEAVRRRSAAEIARLEQDRRNRERIDNQRLLTEIQRTEAARRRAALVGVQGNNSMATSMGLVNRTLFNQRVLLSDLSKQLGIYFSIYQVGAFIKELAMVSGEFEKQRLSLAAILQNKVAADKIFGQIRDLAVYSPFNFSELTNYAKQLSAFSIPANELFDTMKRLADVSAGLGVDMNRIILAYGQVRSAAVLRGQELRQFTEAGIPLVDELAKKFRELNGQAISTGDVFDKISNREVPFQMIKDIFEEMTNEGGKFYKMQEIQATSLSGMISNLRDAYDIMLDSIGSANSETLKGAVSSLVEIMDNWQKYWNILKTIIAAYGTYRATLLVVSAVEKANLAVRKEAMIIMRQNIAQNVAFSKAQVASAARTEVLTKKLNGLKAALAFNPAALFVSGLTIAIGLIASYVSHQNQLEEKLFDTIIAINDESRSVNNLINRLKELSSTTDENSKENIERLKILNKLSETEPDVARAIKDHATNLDELTKAQERYNSAVSIRKFATYAANEDKGMFSDNLIESLTNFNKAQNKSDMAAAKLVKGYNQIEEALSRWKHESVNVTGAMDNLSDATISELNKITSSSDSFIEKILKIRKLVSSTPAGSERVAMHRLKDLMDEGDFASYVRFNNELKKATAEADSNINAFVEDVEGYLKVNNLNINENEKSVRELVKSWKELGDEAQKKILLKLGIEWEGKAEADSDLSAWQERMDKALGTTIKIKADSNLNDVMEEMGKKYKELKTRMDSQKPILIKYKYDFENNVFPNPKSISPVIKQISESFQADKKDVDNLGNAATEVGKKLTDLYTPKDKGGNKKDKVVDGLKKQVELIKDARKQYLELQKVMSKQDAYDKLKTVPEYENVKQENITDDGYISFIREQLDKIKGRNTDAAKEVRIVWNKELGEIQIKKISDDAQKGIAQIEKTLSNHKEKYKLYNQLFELTGDKGQAAKLAFGDSSAAVTTYIDAMKEQLKGMSGGGIYEDLLKVDPKTLTEPVRKMVDDIRQAIQEEDFTFKVDMAKVVSDYATTEEKITAIHNKYESEREKVRNSTDPTLDQDKVIERLDMAESDAVAKLQEELWQLTPFYRQLFGDLSDISYRHLKKMAEDAKEMVMLIATEKKDPDDPNSQLKYGKYDRREKLVGYFKPDEEGNVTKTVINLKEYDRVIGKIASIHKELRNQNPFDSLLRSFDSYKINEGTDQEKEMPMLDIIASKAKDLNVIVQELSGGFGDMFDALGNDSAADATQFIGEMVGAASNVAMGIASGNPVQVISGIVGGISSIAKNHDKKLDRAIEKSKIKVKGLQNAYSELEMVVSRQLGSITQSQAEQQIKNLEQQKRELQSQIRNEKDKKKSDKGAIADYEKQIIDLNDKIRYFYEDLAGEQFGIKIQEWAKSISDALVDAWSKGEDAAKAFDNTVADIMKNVFKSVMQKEYVEKSMNTLRNLMFGSDGRGGVLGDGKLDNRDLSQIVNELANMKKNLGQWQTAWDDIVKAAKEAGINLLENTSEDTLSKGIAGVTEDTANLLASYINAMRADLSMQLSFVGRILANTESYNNYFALMQADIMLIQMNTLRTANNTDRLVELSEVTYSILRNASISGSGVKFNIN